MKDRVGVPVTEAEQKFWTSLKTFFFCDADEQLHWSDIVWVVAVLGFTVYGLIVAVS